MSDALRPANRPARTEPSVVDLILEVRGVKVILDADLATVYGVQTKALNQAVRRNTRRFPADFLFRLSTTEAEGLRGSRSQFVTLKRGQNVKHPPLAFTEHGAIMAASVLNSRRAENMSVFVVRAFVRLRDLTQGHPGVAKKLDELESRVARHDEALRRVFTAVRGLLAAPTPKPHRPIGFRRSH